ncbi:MAG TPA: hypothetical protein VFW02_06470 [Candidatus Limnocylindrales bacterium]|nr:hypothetical protein [Candidatus Limnocylindrales bacterium]
MAYRPSRPLVAGLLIGFLPLIAAEPVGRLAGLCTELFGCTGAIFFSGIPAGIVAGFVVARWWDILELVIGMWLGAAAYAVVLTAARSEMDVGAAAFAVAIQVPLGAGVFIGFLGVPIFVIVALVRWAGRRHSGSGATDRTG